jgi:transcriptional regulator GlxA family with amidase domain
MGGKIGFSLFAGVEVLALAATPEPVVSAQKLRFVPDLTFAASPQLDVVLVPGAETIAPAIDFERRQAPGAEIIASVCAGTFALQKAGLVEGCGATTYWQSKDTPRALGVDVADERWVVDGNVWTAAGVSADIDMAPAFVAHPQGDETGRRVQKGIEYDPAPPFDASAELAAAGRKTGPA